MGDVDYDDEARRGRRRFVMGTAVATAVVVGLGAWVRGTVPPSAALSSAAGVPAVSAGVRDTSAAVVTDRLAAASGRSLEIFAEQSEDPVQALVQRPPVVAGADPTSEKYADTLAELAEAEQAAAEQLQAAKEEANRASSERQDAEEQLSIEEAQAAAAIDAAIDAAIAAAQSRSFVLAPRVEEAPSVTTSGAVPTAEETTADQVLKVVRKYFPADQVGNAMAVARCESDHANRISEPNDDGTRDIGVFQINDGGTLQAALKRIGEDYADVEEARVKALDPVVNVQLARAIWETRGWQPWVCAANLQIVAGLYQRNPGPMAGKYDDYGRA